MEKEITKWTVDTHHSKLLFKVKHLGISNVSGTFKIYTGNVETDNTDFDGASIAFEADANSLSTEHDQRDGHLKSALFFDTEKFPKIIFAGKIHKKADKYELTGQLTIRDVTRDITLAVEYNGIDKDPAFRNTRAGFEVNGKINRRDYGITFNLPTEAGGLVVGEEVKLHFDIELIKLPVNLVPVNQ